jgi:hypothetical protein
MNDALSIPTPAAEPRDLSAVDRFADRMRAKLRANDHKGPWSKDTPAFLLGCLRDEVRELVGELTAPGEVDPERVVSECCDVAAFAMMIADVVGGLPETPRKLVVIPGGQTDTPLAEALRDADRAWARVKLLEARIAAGERGLRGGP